MNETQYEIINAAAARWAEVIWAVSWQFCVLGVIAYLFPLALFRAAPNWRYWLWQILAIKLLLMPFWTATAPWKWPSTTHESVANSAPVANTPQPRIDVPARTAVLATRRQTPDFRKPVNQTHSHAATSMRDKLRSTDASSEHPISSSISRIAPKAQPKSTVKSAATNLAPRQITRLPEVEDLIAKEEPKPASLSLALSPPVVKKVDAVNAKPAEAVKPTPVLSVPQPRLSWQAWLLLGWVACIAWLATRIVWQGAILARRLRTATPAESWIIQHVNAAAHRLGLSQSPEVSVIDLEVSPFVCGFCRPRLILPQGLADSFTPDQLDLVLLHELAHVRRRDLIWGWLPEIAKVFFFFHPLVHFLCCQIRFERELACDQMALLSSGRDVATYADTLVRVVGQFSCPDSFRMAAAESPSS